MSYKIVNIHPSLTAEEKERVDREITRRVKSVFKEYDEKIKRETECKLDK